MRILLVEDEKALSKALSTILKHNQYSVDAVFDGVTALEYLQADIYDLMLLDVMLPKKDGIAVLRELREENNQIPVILLTAKSQTEDKILGLDSGADDYVTKPFETCELLARIRAATRRTGEQKDNVLTLGNLSLHRGTYELCVREKTERLGHKEFQMLEMMLLNSTTYISVERFMEKIWGYDSDTEMSVVWVYLSLLRKKLSSLHSNVRIKTNRNVGYSLEVCDD